MKILHNYLLNYVKIITYTTLFSKYGEDKYQARFPDLDDMATGGEDFNEAYRMAMDLWAGHLSWMEEDDEIPAPLSPENLKPDPMTFSSWFPLASKITKLKFSIA